MGNDNNCRNFCENFAPENPRERFRANVLAGAEQKHPYFKRYCHCHSGEPSKNNQDNPKKMHFSR